MASASLRIKDGNTERVGFRGNEYRGEIIMVRREFTGYSAAFQWHRVTQAQAEGVDPTPILADQIIDRVEQLTINGETWPLTPEALRELRAREFETIAFCIHGRLDPEFVCVADPDKPGEWLEGPYISARDRRGN